MRELSKLQKEILANEDDVLFVEAAAASGKTYVLTERVKQELAKNKGAVVAFTFTVAAAEEMLERLGDIDKTNLFVGTIHSYCFRLLLANGVGEATKYAEEKDFDKLFELVKEHDDCIKPVFSVLCDEMQDCNQAQFDFIFDMLNAYRYFCCYDARQSIYRWRDAHPEYIKYYANKLMATTVSMNENYRNGYAILDYAKGLIQLAGWEYRDTSIAKRDYAGKVVTVEYNPAAIARTIAKMGKFGTWFVLARTNAQVEEMMQALAAVDVPYVTFKRADLSNAELGELMKTDKVKVMTIHTAKGLEADNVVVIGAQFYNTEEKCVSYVAATRARDLLVWTMQTKKRPQKDRYSWER